jgi:hypothetical protein
VRISFALPVGLCLGIFCCQAQAQCPVQSPTPAIGSFTPLNDLGTGTYNGQEGGLYPNGSNQRPPAHDTAGQTIANSIVPLAQNGTSNPSGKVVLLSLGMCNATQEFGGNINTQGDAFKPRADLDPAKDSHVEIVDGAQSSKGADQWAAINPYDPAWANAVTALTNTDPNLRPAQVQIVWMKHAIIMPTGQFPGDSKQMEADLRQILQNVLAFFPNTKIAFLSTRTHAFASEATDSHNPEPYAYETGFGDKFIIFDQINGEADLNFNKSKGPVLAPYACWGPYFWINGLTPRSDGKIWDTTNVMIDLTHPSSCGVHFVADQLLAFFETNPIATPWFLNRHPSGTAPTFTSVTATKIGDSPYTVQFAASATGAVGDTLRYMWDFDDGDFDYDIANPIKQFPAAGTYTVHVTVADTVNGGNATTPVTVNVPSQSRSHRK